MRTLLLSFYLLAFTLFADAQPVKTHGRLHVEKTQLMDEAGHEVVLRGMSFGWHNFWPRFYNAGAVKRLHTDWKASVVRAAMGVEPKNGYIDKPEESKMRIEAVINAAINEGIYVIIDWHSHHIRLEEAKTFFKEMAAKYGKYPNIIYEIFNEPEKDSWADVKAYSTELIATIRSIDSDNVILVGSPHWDQDIHLAADDPIQGYKNLMYTLHYYAGTHKQSLRDRGEYALAKGLPLFISESAGMEATGDGKIDTDEWKKWIQWS
ncbi:MAG TPA: glycoside hydrolase family 5 protein [Hanamia sp.]|nr:glycoside hydrolase family 5 protein [Hanamia sp.]